MELGSTGNYFRGAGEQSHSFVDREPYQKENLKNITLKEKLPFSLFFFVVFFKLFGFWGLLHPRPPLSNVNILMHISIDIGGMFGK